MPNKKTKTHGSFAACTSPSYKETYGIKGAVVWPKKQEANAIIRHYYFVLWDSRQERVKMGMKRGDSSTTSLTTTNYKHRSFLAYLRPIVTLVVYTRNMRGSL